MSVHNNDIAALFEELAELLEIDGANPFRVRAYRDAARVVSSLSSDVAGMLEKGEDLSELPGIGADLADKIATIVETGELPLLDEVAERVPRELARLTRIDGLGPKKVAALYQELGVEGVEDLRAALDEERVSALDGFGAKTAEKIRNGLEEVAGGEKRLRLAEAEQYGESLLEYLRDIDGVKRAEIAGSYRRRKETVGDLDVLVTCKKGTPVSDRFVEYDEVNEVVSHGKTRSTVVLRSGLQVDLRVMPEVAYGAALHYFTGSKAHNIAVRKMGVKRGLKINEYGVFEGEERVAGRTERAVYRQVGLPYIAPELREDRGEIEVALDDALPTLVSERDLRGDLHMHTKATDGHHSLREMAEAARERGYDYVAITDHSQQVRVANGMDAKRTRRQLEAIDALNDTLDGITVLKGIEVDILEDGDLDLPNDVLAELDWVVCSVHSKFDLSRKKQTERVIRAMDNPYFMVLAHPSGRLINKRRAYDIDMERIIEAAAERGRMLELNSQPSRLDLTDTDCMLAKDHGVRIVISSDAHSRDDLDNVRFGVGQARRGWLTKQDVANTLSWKRLRQLVSD